MSRTTGTFSPGDKLYVEYEIENNGGGVGLKDKFRFLTGPKLEHQADVAKLTTSGNLENVIGHVTEFMKDSTGYTIGAGPSPGATVAPKLEEIDNADGKKIKIKDEVEIDGKLYADAVAIAAASSSTAVAVASHNIAKDSVITIVATTKHVVDTTGIITTNGVFNVTINDKSTGTLDNNNIIVNVSHADVQLLLNKFDSIVTRGGKRARRKSSKRKSAKHKRGGRRGRRKSNKHRR